MVLMVVDGEWHVETDVCRRGGDTKAYVDVAPSLAKKSKTD